MTDMVNFISLSLSSMCVHNTHMIEKDILIFYII